MTTGKSHRHKNKSLCERSTMIAINILKVSSLCLAKITIGSPAPPPASMHARVTKVPLLMPSGDPRSKRLVEPEGSTTSYLMEPDEGKGVDQRADDYIARFRERNKSDPSIHAETFKCIPPPPNRTLYRS